MLTYKKIAYMDQKHISLFYPLSFKPVLFSVVKVLGTYRQLYSDRHDR